MELMTAIFAICGGVVNTVMMGLPEGWTEYGADGKPISSTQRYRALGNSIALPCADYLMTGIAEVLGT